MKRVLVVLLLVAVGAGLAAEDEVSVRNWSGHFESGDTALSLGVGVGLGGNTLSLAAYPGFEQVFADFKIADTVPMSIGAGARGLASLYIGGINGIAVGAGVFVPFHFGLDGLGLGFIDQLDFYLAPGVGVSLAIGDLGWTDPLRIRFAQYAGINFFLSESMAVFVEEVYWGYYTGATLGVLLKL